MAAVWGERRRPHRHALDIPRPRQPSRHLLVSLRFSRVDATRRRAARGALRSGQVSALAPALQAYFTDRLMNQRLASPNTIAAYKLTFQLLLRFSSERLDKTPSMLDIAEMDASLIAGFLDHLERDRHNRPITRNNRLAAIHSFFSYLALHYPEHAGSIQRVLSIPPKRTDRKLALLTFPWAGSGIDGYGRQAVERGAGPKAGPPARQPATL